jgi:uncharacterized protein YndB with AHSA1/START domain
VADIAHFIKIGAAPEQVYAALTTAEGVRSWWTRDADLDAHAGAFRFIQADREHRVRVDGLTPPSRVTWTVTASFVPDWVGTTIDFDIRADGDGAALLFAHRGFAHANERYAMFNTGWAYYLVSLQQYLQTGQGAPSPDVDFGQMVR